jgi:glycosyltransferase involved in cell wall biosynthesis
VVDPSGYSEHARSVIFGLYQIGVDIELSSLSCFTSTLNSLPLEYQEVLKEISKVKVSPKAPKICITTPEFYAPEKDRYNIGFTAWETDRLPKPWLPYMQSMDEIWSPSTFCTEVYKKDLTKPVYTIGEGVDTQLFNPYVEPAKIVNKKKFTFFSMFQWTWRKAPDVLLKAYASEFTSSDDVCLLLRVYGSNESVEEHARLKKEIKNYVESVSSDPPLILYVSKYVPHINLPRLICACDCGVFPSRGEGFNRPALETMACGRPVIVTNWSGHLDFVTDRTGFLVDLDCFSQVSDMSHIPWYTPDMKWAEPCVKSLREKMRYAYEHQAEVKEKGKKARWEAMTKWDNVVIAKRIKERLEETSKSV